MDLKSHWLWIVVAQIKANHKHGAGLLLAIVSPLALRIVLDEYAKYLDQYYDAVQYGTFSLIIAEAQSGGVLGPLYHPYGCSSCISLRLRKFSLSRPQRTHSQRSGRPARPGATQTARQSDQQSRGSLILSFPACGGLGEVNTRLKATRKSVKTAVIIGSGGHTTEMLKLVQELKPEKYTPRMYFVASNDTTSEVRILKLEGENKSDYEIIKIPRSRNVHQSFVSSFATTLYAVAAAVPYMLTRRPELILCNGPGTCIPICLIAFAMRTLSLCDNRIVFVESVCRVKTLSLTGKILLLFADELFVQWPQLKNQYKPGLSNLEGLVGHNSNSSKVAGRRKAENQRLRVAYQWLQPLMCRRPDGVPIPRMKGDIHLLLDHVYFEDLQRWRLCSVSSLRIIINFPVLLQKWRLYMVAEKVSKLNKFKDLVLRRTNPSGNYWEFVTKKLFMLFGLYRVAGVNNNNWYELVDLSGNDVRGILLETKVSGRCRWSAGFLGDLSFPLPFDSDATPY
ncbi:hypothetical protein PR048_029244 [Dryococelus australis]|uniref:UDP-N-acetylglucosamine transferase subunit ALG14 n=1 Tax=Dryococelus australis TaxID=614101 RepID=A0ABQ9GDH6_9NEOP|nr:hypothetical protein PR048_029244 [Dryococelus australis]